MNDSRPALNWRPLVVPWLLTMGVDFFFNAGLFFGLFDQGREPCLLADQVLVRRIPVAVPDSAARAAETASDGSDLPTRLRC